MAQIIIYSNPFNAREKTISPIADGDLFIDWLQTHYPSGFPKPSIIFRNGCRVDVENFDFVVCADDVVEIRPHIGDPGTLGIIILSAVVATAAAYVAVQFLPDPDTPSSIGGGPSPTYNLQAQSNQVRIGEPIPAIYGRHRIYPNLAAIPWSEFVQDDQFLHQLFCVGHGEFELEAIKIDDTPLTEFNEITSEIVTPGNEVTLFNDHVVTSIEVKRIELFASNDVARTGKNEFEGATAQIRLIKVGDPVELFQKPWNISFTIGDSVTIRNTPPYDGDYIVDGFVGEGIIILSGDNLVNWPPAKADVEITEIRLSDFTDISDPTFEEWTGPFTVNPIGTLTNELALDFEFPTGLYFVDGGGSFFNTSVDIEIEWQEIDDLDDPIGPPETRIVDFTRATPKPVRHTEKILVSPGRYRVRCHRDSNSVLQTTTQDTVFWVGLKARLQDIQNYGQLTMIAIKMKATNQLDSVSSKKVNVIVTRKLPIWNGSLWSEPVATRSIAWAIADIWMTSYGGNRSFRDLDTDGLIVLDAIWVAKGDFFDAVFDQQITLWEALTRAARVGRAKPVLSGNILTIVRDQLQTVRTAMFVIRNIVKASFSIEYSFDDNRAPDGVRLKYLDNVTFTEEVVQPNVNATRPKEVTLFGCTEYEQAFREALYVDAAQKFQRRRITFTTELGGHIPMFGDLIAISHHTPRWGVGGEVLAVNGLELTLSEEPDFSSGGPFLILLRRKDGSVEEPIPCGQVAANAPNKVLLESAPSFTILTDFDLERTYFSFGTDERFTQDAIVEEIVPRGNKKVKITCVNFDPRIHEVDTGVIPPKIGVVFPTEPIAPSVTGLVLLNVPNSGIVDAEWNPAFSNITEYRVETSKDNIDFIFHETVTTTTTSIVALGILYVRVAAVFSDSIGEFSQASITVT